MATTATIVTGLVLACHVAIVMGDYLGPMPEPDLSSLKALRVAITKKRFPEIKCDGYFFLCDDSRRVYELYLRVQFFEGYIAPEIGNLTKLKSIILSDNLLTGSIPSSIGRLTSLERLYLGNFRLTVNYRGNNQLTGSIPSSIGHLKSLKLLSINSNKLSGSLPWSIGQLTSLKTLELDDNQLSGSIPWSIGQLTSLEDLYLSKNKLSGSVPWSIGNMTSLAAVLLNDNQLSGSLPSSVSQLTLGILDITKNFFTGIVKEIHGNPSCGQLRANCLFGLKLPSRCNPKSQRSKIVCDAFCNATQPGGPCGGGGICSNGTSGTSPTCACKKGYSNRANKFTCKLLPKPPPPRSTRRP